MGQVGLGLIVGLTMVFHPDFKGPEGRINDNSTLVVNEYLSSVGFMKGDRLIGVDGGTFNASNTVSRANGRTNRNE